MTSAEKTFADHLFDTHREFIIRESEFVDRLSDAGFPDSWIDSVTFDEYDASVEFKTEQDAVFTDEMQSFLKGLGFVQGWLNYPGNKVNGLRNEKHFYWGPSK